MPRKRNEPHRNGIILGVRFAPDLIDRIREQARRHGKQQTRIVIEGTERRVSELENTKPA